MPQPRKHKSNAARQKAYRERQKATRIDTQHAAVVKRVMIAADTHKDILDRLAE